MGDELLNDLTFRQDLMEGDEVHRPPLHLPMLALANVGIDYNHDTRLNSAYLS